MRSQSMIKQPVETQYQKELAALTQIDQAQKPRAWKLSPQAVRTFILGSSEPVEYDGEEITIRQKFFGDDLLVERAIITLTGNRGLMLVGEPGTAKTFLSELLSAAICGTSTNTIQGTAGTSEDMIKYSWNYALLLARGPKNEALVPAPLYRGMKDGIITRFEEITRCPAEVQDTLISVLSDQVLMVPELEDDGVVFSKSGFNLIATANTRDKGINEMSSALKRRFNFETVFPIKDPALESRIIEQEADKLLSDAGINLKPDKDVVSLLSTVFHELREGVTTQGHRIDRPEAVMSTAEGISVYYQSAMSAYYYGKTGIMMDSLVQNMMGTVIKDNRGDIKKLRAYFNIIIKERSGSLGGLWKDYFEAKKFIR